MHRRALLGFMGLAIGCAIGLPTGTALGRNDDAVQSLAIRSQLDALAKTSPRSVRTFLRSVAKDYEAVGYGSFSEALRDAAPIFALAGWKPKPGEKARRVYSEAHEGDGFSVRLWVRTILPRPEPRQFARARSAARRLRLTLARHPFLTLPTDVGATIPDYQRIAAALTSHVSGMIADVNARTLPKSPVTGIVINQTPGSFPGFIDYGSDALPEVTPGASGTAWVTNVDGTKFSFSGSLLENGSWYLVSTSDGGTRLSRSPAPSPAGFGSVGAVSSSLFFSAGGSGTLRPDLSPPSPTPTPSN